ncbi:MAG: type VI secretion system baseplate subunit TssE [Planctomycetota bacterium]
MMDKGNDRVYLAHTLLDRLRSDGPCAGGNLRALTADEQRASVLKDLEFLFNTGNLASVVDLENHPRVARSVLNYGVPCFAGRSLSIMGEEEFKRLFRQAIIDFEPRIDPKSVEVDVHIAGDSMNQTAVTLRIRGRLLTELELVLKTDVDLETGSVTISDETKRTLKDKESDR